MYKWNYSDARAQLSIAMDQAIAGHPIEITRRGREPVVLISKELYEFYRKAARESTQKNINPKVNF